MFVIVGLNSFTVNFHSLCYDRPLLSPAIIDYHLMIALPQFHSFLMGYCLRVKSDRNLVNMIFDFVRYYILKFD